RTISLSALLMLAAVLTGYLFDVNSLFGIITLPMPINSLLAFMIALPLLVSTIYSDDLFPVFRNIIRQYWTGLVVFTLIIMLTAVIWRQTSSNIATTNQLQA